MIDLAGIFPPIPTPFTESGALNAAVLNWNFSWWSKHELRGYVVLGSNGEAVLLDCQEKLALLQQTRAAIPPGKLLIAGTGCEATAATIALTQQAAEAGADVALVITPSFYRGRMTSATLIRHYIGVADASPLPLILYNMPACTGIDLDVATIVTLSEHPNIVGLKDSGGNVAKLSQVYHEAESGFQLLAGSASFLLPALSVGAVGGVLALANIAPGICLDIFSLAVKDGDWQRAKELQASIVDANAAVTRRWAVPALKAAMDLLGLHGGPVRAPLQPICQAERDQLNEILTRAGILPQEKPQSGKECVER